MPITAEEIRAARLALGESQSAFAERFGVSQNSVSRWEREGVPPRGTASLVIARFLEDMRARG